MFWSKVTELVKSNGWDRSSLEESGSLGTRRMGERHVQLEGALRRAPGRGDTWGKTRGNRKSSPGEEGEGRAFYPGPEMGKASVLGKLQVFQWLEHGTDLEREAGPLEKVGRGKAAVAVEEDEGLGWQSWLGAQPDTSGQGVPDGLELGASGVHPGERMTAGVCEE